MDPTSAAQAPSPVSETPLAQPPVDQPEAPQSVPPQSTPLRVRKFELLLLLGIAIAPAILNAFFSYFLFGTGPRPPSYIPFRLSTVILQEAGSLALLCYILFRQGRSLRDIGFSFRWLDIPISFGLLILCWISAGIVYAGVNLLHHFWTGHYVERWDNAVAMLGTHVSFLAVVFLVLNAFFEELIVRGYLMSEITAWKNNVWLAGLVSVGIQSLYHIYQGVPNMISIAGLFTVYAIYYGKTRRILPVILAHFYVDAVSAAYLFFHH